MFCFLLSQRFCQSLRLLLRFRVISLLPSLHFTFSSTPAKHIYHLVEHLPILSSASDISSSLLFSSIFLPSSQCHRLCSTFEISYLYISSFRDFHLSCSTFLVLSSKMSSSTALLPKKKKDHASSLSALICSCWRPSKAHLHAHLPLFLDLHWTKVLGHLSNHHRILPLCKLHRHHQLWACRTWAWMEGNLQTIQHLLPCFGHISRSCGSECLQPLLNTLLTSTGLVIYASPSSSPCKPATFILYSTTKVLVSSTSKQGDKESGLVQYLLFFRACIHSCRRIHLLDRSISHIEETGR